jgi:N-alpha-acetyl-L-2,4-diaminobutyrate deacetylase
MSHVVECSIDLGASGRQIGRLRVPADRRTGAATIVPIASIANGKGPTVLVSGGNHGDEYEGQLAALRLLREIDPAQVSGRIIVVPVISMEASRAGTRTWPTGENFNRSFPGDPDGPPIEQLAHFFTTVLFNAAEVVIDMHSSGFAGWIPPCSHMSVPKDRAQRRKMVEAMEAWNSDLHFFYTSDNNYLPNEAEKQGKIVVTTELGGTTRIPVATQDLAWSGLTNVLRHVGVLDGKVQTRASLGLPPAKLFDARHEEAPAGVEVKGMYDHIPSPITGLFEVMVDPGTMVTKGQVLGRVWPAHDPSQPPAEVKADRSGCLMGIRTRPPVEKGLGLAMVGLPVDREALLAE